MDALSLVKPESGLRARLSDAEAQDLEAPEEHRVVRRTVSGLDGMPPEHERVDARSTVSAPMRPPRWRTPTNSPQRFEGYEPDPNDERPVAEYQLQRAALSPRPY
jgi:hypothetical protein